MAMKIQVFWVVTSCSRDIYVSEDHVASIFKTK